MRLSLSEISTVNASFEEDLRAYAAAGFEGIGIWESKLGEGSLEAFRASGLRAANCVPGVPSILPIPGVIPGPADVEERVAALCASMARLAAYEPESVLVLTGPGGPRSAVVDGLRRVAEAAREADVRLGLEPVHPSQRELLSTATSIDEALDLLDEAGLDDVGVLVDWYHVWDSPSVIQNLQQHTSRIAGVHVCDRPADPKRTDRILPGEGVSRPERLVAALRSAGWDGSLDVEIFSTPDRFWALPVDEAARRAYEAAARLL